MYLAKPAFVVRRLPDDMGDIFRRQLHAKAFYTAGVHILDHTGLHEQGHDVHDSNAIGLPFDAQGFRQSAYGKFRR